MIRVGDIVMLESRSDTWIAAIVTTVIQADEEIMAGYKNGYSLVNVTAFEDGEAPRPIHAVRIFDNPAIATAYSRLKSSGNARHQPAIGCVR